MEPWCGSYRAPTPERSPKYRRPNADRVSVERGALPPYGPFPRLVVLWMAYAAAIRSTLIVLSK